MKTTLILDDLLVAAAMWQSGVKVKAAVVRPASLGGAMQGLKVAPRWRSVQKPV